MMECFKVLMLKKMTKELLNKAERKESTTQCSSCSYAQSTHGERLTLLYTMNEIKVSVSIVLQGSILLTQEEAETLEKEQPKSGFEKHTQVVENPNGKNKQVIHYQTRKCRTACQSVKLCKEAYLHMIDKSACPEWEKMNKWTSKSNKERLESHLQKLTEHLGGISFTYKVFED